MKKFAILALAALLVLSFTVPASALENIFGGYWRTRFFTQKNFDGDNTGALDLRWIDTRTRLYYTAKLNDNLKLVNKFEMDTVWGNNATAAYAINAGQSTTGGGAAAAQGPYSPNWGDVGTDGVAIEIKNSYADFNVGPVNFLVGAQTFTLARGFISDEDALGLKAIWKVNEGLYLPFIYQKLKEGGAGKDANENDVEAYIFAPIIMLSKDIKVNPYYVFLHAEDGQFVLGSAYALNTTAGQLAGGIFDNLNASVIGVDFDAKMGAASLWLTGIMQFGSGTLTPAGAAALSVSNSWANGPFTAKKALAAGDTVDLAGYLVAAGGKFDFGKGDVHGQAFYATGEDKNGVTDGEYNAYFTTASNTYYWAEIMGGGSFDNSSGAQITSSGACGVAPSNILAANLGVTVKPTNKLTVTADVWYAKLAEENFYGEDDLGIETDLKVSYKLVEGLTIDIIGAYLFAGDATERQRFSMTGAGPLPAAGGGNGKNEKDPYEFGTMLSLSF